MTTLVATVPCLEEYGTVVFKHGGVLLTQETGTVQHGSYLKNYMSINHGSALLIHGKQLSNMVVRSS